MAEEEQRRIDDTMDGSFAATQDKKIRRKKESIRACLQQLGWFEDEVINEALAKIPVQGNADVSEVANVVVNEIIDSQAALLNNLRELKIADEKTAIFLCKKTIDINKALDMKNEMDHKNNAGRMQNPDNKPAAKKLVVNPYKVREKKTSSLWKQEKNEATQELPTSELIDDSVWHCVMDKFEAQNNQDQHHQMKDATGSLNPAEQISPGDLDKKKAAIVTPEKRNRAKTPKTWHDHGTDFDSDTVQDITHPPPTGTLVPPETASETPSWKTFLAVSYAEGFNPPERAYKERQAQEQFKCYLEYLEQNKLENCQSTYYQYEAKLKQEKDKLRAEEQEKVVEYSRFLEENNLQDSEEICKRYERECAEIKEFGKMGESELSQLNHSEEESKEEEFKDEYEYHGRKLNRGELFKTEYSDYDGLTDTDEDFQAHPSPGWKQFKIAARMKSKYGDLRYDSDRDEQRTTRASSKKKHTHVSRAEMRLFVDSEAEEAPQPQQRTKKGRRKVDDKESSDSSWSPSRTRRRNKKRHRINIVDSGGSDTE